MKKSGIYKFQTSSFCFKTLITNMFVHNLFNTVDYNEYLPMVSTMEPLTISTTEYEQLRMLLYKKKSLILSTHVGEIYFQHPKKGRKGIIDSVRLAVDTYRMETFEEVLEFINEIRAAGEYIAFYTCQKGLNYMLRLTTFPTHVNEIIRSRFREDRIDGIIEMCEKI